MHEMKRVVVIGSSISGALAACYLKLRFPEMEILAIHRRRDNLPIVGESLTEFSTLMLHEIGLGPYLEEEHFHKYGLTFYFKEKIGDPSDLTYATHEAMRIPPMPSNQINRFKLDERLRERARELGVVLVEGTARDVELGRAERHRVTYRDPRGEERRIEASWIVDASGRSRFLASRLGLEKKPRFQRSSFWFRLEGFDRSILKQMKEVKAPQYCFDSYFVTHHFFGKGNWIWAIPIRPEPGEGRDLISIGIVYRPDLYEGGIRSIEEFLDRVGAEHPVIARLVESGRVVDTNAYRNYFYETQKSYSRDGWFLIGDAGDTVDPLYSTGIVMTSIQIKQVAAIIAADCRGELSEAYVTDLENTYRTIRDTLQLEISTLYEVMDDPFQSHLRMHFSSAFYFFFLLPAWLSGYLTDRVGARFIVRVLEDGAGGYESLKSLLATASRRLGRVPSERIENLYAQTVNWDLDGPADREISRYLASFCLFFAKTRFRLLRGAGWREPLKHGSQCLVDLLKAGLFGVLLRGRPIKDLRLIRRAVSL